MNTSHGRAAGSGEAGTAIVVGGSLCGLACGMALARSGFAVTLFERQRAFAGGSGMGVDLDLLGSVLGEDARRTLPVITGNRYSTSWRALYGWLLERARAQPGLVMTEGVSVDAVGQTDDQALVDVDGSRHTSDVLVGADGYRSIVRAAVDPENADAEYAGYVLWRGLIEERELPGLPSARSLPGNRVSVQYAGPYRLVAYAVPGTDGSIEPGRRQISWAWYDPHRIDLLEQTGSVANGAVQRGLSAAEIPGEVLNELIARATTCWSAPWGEAVAASIALGRIFATPIAEYMPRQLVNGRLAMLGDAAHVVSPMTGAGYVTGLEDIRSLTARLSETRLPVRERHAVVDRLRLFEADRLEPGRHLVASSRHWSREFLASGRNKQPC